MRNFLLLAFFIPFFALAQKTNSSTFIKLTTASGQQINGDNTDKGFEKWINGLTMNTSGKKNETIAFTMNITGAAADLKKAMNNGEILPNGEIDVMRPMDPGGARRLPLYVIKMENIRVLSCTESIGCNGTQVTNVTLQASRIGWIYYDVNRPGLTVTNKYGYDVEKGVDWTGF